MGTRKERNRPTHSLEEAKELAACGRMTLNGRARRFIQNRHGRYDMGRFVSELFSAISPSDFRKSVELEVIPGAWGDVYSGFEYDGETWYVKFLIASDGTARLDVLSANWDGYIH